jgi:uncharacterized protein
VPRVCCGTAIFSGSREFEPCVGLREAVGLLRPTAARDRPAPPGCCSRAAGARWRPTPVDRESVRALCEVCTSCRLTSRSTDATGNARLLSSTGKISGTHSASGSREETGGGSAFALTLRRDEPPAHYWGPPSSAGGPARDGCRAATRSAPLRPARRCSRVSPSTERCRRIGDRRVNSPVQSKAEIIQRLRGAGRQLTALGVSGIGLFGSFVTGRQTAASDVDVLIDFAPGQRSFDNFMDASFLLEGVLGRRVELVTRESLSPHIGPHILREVERVSLAA